MEIKQVGVLGAGTMGTGIALVFAEAGLKVRLVDIDENMLQAASEKIKKFWQKAVDLQTSLLRVLEDKTITRVGGHVVIPTNIRLISATNKILIEEIKHHNFRNDLYFRLNVISITIPALRNRQGDIPILAEYFMRTISTRVGKKIDKIDPNLIDILLEHDWPGNIRELSNVIERAINLARNNTLTIDLLPPEINQRSSGSNISLWRNTPTKDDVEEQVIRNYLLKFEDNKSEVAKALNISRSCLYRKMSKYNIK